jgi:hypothetical protein
MCNLSKSCFKDLKEVSMMERVKENHIVVAEAEAEAEIEVKVGVKIETKAANQAVVGVEKLGLEVKAEIDMIEVIEVHVHQL